MKSSPFFAISASNNYRVNNTDVKELEPANLNLTETLPNEALVNITISILSLNTWFEMVNGSSTRLFNSII
jgi:hypothetical protein